MNGTFRRGGIRERRSEIPTRKEDKLELGIVGEEGSGQVGPSTNEVMKGGSEREKL